MSKPAFEGILTFSGRRNRLSYLLYLIACSAALIVIWGVGGLLAWSDGG